MGMQQVDKGSAGRGRVVSDGPHLRVMLNVQHDK